MESFDLFNPTALARGISSRLKILRLSENLSQEALSKRSGVSLGSLKRFEQNGEISLKHLLMLAVTLGAGEEFASLFPAREYKSIDDLLKLQSKPQRKRGRKKI